MATITGLVKYVNPVKEGKKKGSIKLADGTMIGVWPDKLALFTAGHEYEIEYSEDGQWKTVKTAKPKGGDAPAAKPAMNGNGGGTYRPTSPQDAERMFVCSILNAFVQQGNMVLVATDLIEAVTTLRDTWQNTFGRDGAKIVPRADMGGDEVPY